jgi:hypothetical protein
LPPLALARCAAFIEASKTPACDKWVPLISTARAVRTWASSTSSAEIAMSAQFSR